MSHVLDPLTIVNISLNWKTGILMTRTFATDTPLELSI